MGAKPSLDQWNLLISGGFQAPTGAEPPWKDKKVQAPPGQIPEYAPGYSIYFFQIDNKETAFSF